MKNVSRWRDSGHLERAVESAGGQEAFDNALANMLNDVLRWATGRDAQEVAADDAHTRGNTG